MFFFFNDTATTEIYTLSLHDALPICAGRGVCGSGCGRGVVCRCPGGRGPAGTVRRGICSVRRVWRSEEHTSELQSRSDLVCRLLLEKKKASTAAHCTTCRRVWQVPRS